MARITTFFPVLFYLTTWIQNEGVFFVTFMVGLAS